jgi:hypothetical protein
LETEATDLVFWWAEKNGITSQVQVLKGTIMFWGLMVCYRCVYPNNSFNLTGTTNREREIRRNQRAFTPFYNKVRGIANSPTIIRTTIIMPNDDAILGLKAAIESGQVVVGFSKRKNSRIIHTEAFINDVRGSILGTS